MGNTKPPPFITSAHGAVIINCAAVFVMDENYTTTLGSAPNRSWGFWLGKTLGKTLRNSIPEYLIDYAKRKTGRHSIAYETAMGIANRKRKRPSVPGSFWMGGIPKREASRKKIKVTQPKASAGSGPITTQQDYKISRGRKRLNKRQKRWKSFVRKVQKAETANDKTHFLVEANNAAAAISGTAGISLQQVCPTTASGDDYNFQLSAVGNIVTGPLLFVDNLYQQKSVTTVAAGTVNVRTTLNDLKYKLLGASCTISWKNFTAQTIFVDIYECVASQNIIDANFATARQAWQYCLANNSESDQLVARTTLLTTFTGCTPYQAPGFAKYWKIIKKTRVLCASGSKTNYTYYTKSRMINNAKVVGHYATKGLTKDLIIVANPTFNGDTIAAATQIGIEWSKSYAIKMDDIAGLQTQWAYQIPY